MLPPLAAETWRMEMMSAERQKTSPFFLGGETILVSFPTQEMEQPQIDAVWERIDGFNSVDTCIWTLQAADPCADLAPSSESCMSAT